MTYDLIISVVLYHNKKQEIETLLKGLDGLRLNYLLVFVDNAPGQTNFDFTHLPKGTKYIASEQNLGYGKGHNLVLNARQWQAKYYLIANVDIEFKAVQIEAIYAKMEQSPEVALLMPKIIYPNGDDQGLRKLLPRPSDLFVRRFLPAPLKSVFRKQTQDYELLGLNPDLEMRVPVLSGCFMFCRSEAIKACQGFDPRFFLYMEDVDLSRRLNLQGINLYWPEVSIIHHYQKGSYRNWKALKLHLKSAVQYFNKYGWFLDAERARINKAALQQKQDLKD
jgi:GT2 family glycosyltransferase